MKATTIRPVLNLYLIFIVVGPLLIIFTTTTNSFCQSDEVPPNQPEAFRKHRFTLFMANSIIPAADNVDGQNQLFIVPAWGIHYDYWLSPAIGLGFHNDVILQQYKIEKSDDQAIIERSFPVIITGVFLFKPSPKWTVLIGGGKEFEKHENFSVIKAGIEYGIELPHSWELNLSVVYDNKLNAYDSWMAGVGFSKFVSFRHK